MARCDYVAGVVSSFGGTGDHKPVVGVPNFNFRLLIARQRDFVQRGFVVDTDVVAGNVSSLLRSRQCRVTDRVEKIGNQGTGDGSKHGNVELVERYLVPQYYFTQDFNETVTVFTTLAVWITVVGVTG